MRKSLAILLALAASLFFVANGPAPARDGQYRSIAVDTSRIAASGHAHLAQTLKPMLAGELSKALGPRLGRSGAVLTVRITRIKISASNGEENWGGSIDDSIEGVAVVPGRGQIPIRVVLPQNAAGAWYTQGFDQRRVYRLIEAFAQWTAREV